MSFWQKQDGSAVENTTSFEMGGGDIKPIPNNTALIAAIEEAKWDSYEGVSYISLKWRVMRPAEYANRVLFQKLHVFDHKKGDKAKQMLMAIDANCGCKLARLNDAPEDYDLMALIGKPMAAKVQVWEINDKSGNWISAVSPAKKQAPTRPTPQAQNAHNQAKSNAYQAQDDDDSIPF